LKIVASQDIGELGPKEGTAVLYKWKWYYSIPGFALWLVLLGAIVLVKANRNPRALLILLPLLAVNLLWFGFVKLLQFPSSSRAQFDSLFASYTVGISVLWLFAHKLGNRNRFVAFLVAFVLMAVLGLVGAVSYSGLEFSQQTVGTVILLAVLTLAMLLGFALAGWRCRRRYTNLRFMLYLAFWTVAACLAITFVVYAVVFAINQASVPVSTVLLVSLMAGLALGAYLYVIVFPFMILALRCSFFRERFFACLRLKSMPATVRQVAADGSGQPNVGPEMSESGDSG